MLHAGLSSDVYSFGVLLWEMLTLKPAYDKYTRDRHYKEVIVEGKRPKISNKWPFVIRNLLERCWHKEPLERPTFFALCGLIKLGMPDDAEASDRSNDLLLRSLRSTRGNDIGHDFLEDSRHNVTAAIDNEWNLPLWMK